MSFPTTLGAWYVCQRLRDDGTMEYYTSQEDSGEKELFTPRKAFALLFMSLASAVRVAEGTVAEVRVLTSRADAKEFGRE